MRKSIKLYELLDEMLLFHKPNIKKKTYMCYSLAIVHIKQRIPNKKLKKIKEFDLQKCLNDMYLESDYAKSTINKVKIVLNLAYKHAIRAGYTRNNLTSNLIIPKNAKKKL